MKTLSREEAIDALVAQVDNWDLKTLIGVAIGMLVGILYAMPNQTTNPLDCVEHAMIDGMPYCGVYRSNGTLCEVTMSDIAASQETISIN